MQAEVYLNLKPADSLQLSVARERLAMHDQPGYIGNCNILIKNMVSWQEHQVVLKVKIQLSSWCILREHSTVG